MADLKMSLEENAKSFLVEALSEAVKAERDKQRWKFAILFLIQAIELTLKERLRHDHWSLIYSNLDKLKCTVTLNQALSRLEKISKLEIERKDIDTIHTALEWRNLVVHYEFEFSIERLKTVFSRLLGFYSSFNQKHLAKEMYAFLPQELMDEALKIEEYTQELVKRAKERIEEENIDYIWVWECPSCGYETFVVQDNICTCYVCGFSDEVVECEDCGHIDFVDEMTEIEIGNMKGHDLQKCVCKSCAAKYEDDAACQEYWETFTP